MAKGKLISKADATEYEVEFDLTEFANLKKEPVSGTTTSGKHTFKLTVKNDSAIPAGDYELHSDSGAPTRDVLKSSKGWDVV
jgi:hypothetical protein